MVAAIGGAVAGAFVVACGGTDGGGDATDTNEGGTFGDAGTDPGDPPEDLTEAGIFMSHADAGCPVKYAGPRPGTIAQSIPRTGVTTGKAWNDPSGGLSIDGQYASAPLADGEKTELLRVTGYGFDIPANVSIKGVVVQLKRQGGTRIVDGNIELWLDGVASDRPKFIASGWPIKVGTHHYGQEVDTWGNDLTPALINKPGFGTEIWAKHREDAGAEPATAEIESLIVTIWYCD
ncbi:MAG: hypothetical protein JWP87_1396 [Labilithrix sp.]|nr:hypothetical protein [Labilithrix sp.]